jgi:hypothetical protein
LGRRPQVKWEIEELLVAARNARYVLDMAYGLRALGYNERNAEGNSPDESGVTREVYAAEAQSVQLLISTMRKKLVEVIKAAEGVSND